MRTVRFLGVLSLSLFLAVGCRSADDGKDGEEEKASAESPSSSEGASKDDGTEPSRGDRAMPDEPVKPDVKEGRAVATFAGGCFWCMEKPFERLEGVHSVVSGFCGGDEKNPKYKEVAKGKTGHAESVQIVYDPDEISYEKLLKVYWRQIDPTDAGGQFVDRGSQYRPVVFYHDERQKKLAKESKKRLSNSGRFDESIVVNIVPASKFWRANDYHQNFYETHPKRYKSYRRGSGRDEFLRKHWGEDRKVE